MKKSVAREYYEAILVAFILALFVRTFVFENFKIPSRSMEDGLLVGDHLVVNKFLFSEHFKTPLHSLLPYRSPERGDVVVFKYPEDPARGLLGVGGGLEQHALVGAELGVDIHRFSLVETVDGVVGHLVLAPAGVQLVEVDLLVVEVLGLDAQG